MTDSTPTIQGLRDRLTGLLADWGAELAVVLKELEEKRARVAELESAAASNAELDQLKQQLDGQTQLIETLRSDAEEAQKARDATASEAALARDAASAESEAARAHEATMAKGAGGAR